MRRILRRLLSDRGVTAIEYAFIASLIALVIVGAVAAIGVALQTPFNDVASNLP